MTRSGQIAISDMLPEDVWAELSKSKSSALVDCRTQMEWARIGTPDLSQIDAAMYLVEWRSAPDMSVNASFAEEMDAATGGAYPSKLYFICRSGVRSKEAAHHMQEVLSSKSIDCTCINVAEGFEGTQTPEIIAAGTSGWQNKNLPKTR
jgi:rhodanese-related sulfurtransferase